MRSPDFRLIHLWSLSRLATLPLSFTHKDGSVLGALCNHNRKPLYSVIAVRGGALLASVHHVIVIRLTTGRRDRQRQELQSALLFDI